MQKWDDYVRKLIAEINKYESAIVVGITGSHLRRKKDDKYLRVYVNGGDALKIPLKEGNVFKFADDYFKAEYFGKSELQRIGEIKEIVLNNPYAWNEYENEYALLGEYLRYVESATKKKFGSLKETSNAKERMNQIKLFKKLMSDSSKDYAFMDVEFQTICEMNYSDKEIEEWLKSHSDTKGMHCGKPDYIAICPNGFYMIELKTNKGSIEGKAGIGEHNDDFKELIEMNKKNQVLVAELKERLQVMYDYGLLNKSYNDLAESILDKDVKELSVDAKYLFITNENFTEEQCRRIISEKGIDEKDVIFEENAICELGWNKIENF